MNESAQLIDAAKTYHDLFGPKDVTEDTIQGIYKKYSKEVHPDTNGSEYEETFKKLYSLKVLALAAIHDGTYNQRILATIKSSINEYRLIGFKLFDGFRRYNGLDKKGKRVWLDISTSPKNNSSFVQERKTSQTLIDLASQHGFASYFCPVIDNFVYVEKGYHLEVNVRRVPSGEWLYLPDCKNNNFCWEDIAWTTNRIFDVYGFIHANKVAGIDPNLFIVGVGSTHNIMLTSLKSLGSAIKPYSDLQAYGKLMSEVAETSPMPVKAYVSFFKGFVGSGLEAWKLLAEFKELTHKISRRKVYHPYQPLHQ